jgi:hypothetical protein
MASGGEVGGSIQVEGLGETMGTEHLQAYSEAPGEVLLVLEESPQGFSCGIVGAQDQCTGLGVEPLMGRTIQEQHLSLLR